MAGEFARRLRSEGHSTETVDYLALLPLKLGSAVKAYYGAQLRYAPWSYERSYQYFARMRDRFASLNAAFSKRRLTQAIQQFDADIIVSNNPHASMALGRLRETGEIKTPVVTYVTDFGAHALWIHPGVDETFVIHDITAAEARSAGGRNVTVVTPVVSDKFQLCAETRSAARSALGLPSNTTVAVLTAGSWGVGKLVETVQDLQHNHSVTPVVACGRSRALRKKVAALANCVALGWVDDMPALFNAADVLIENAGGISSLEALRCGLPVISYRPIAGHGRHNVQMMAAAGLTTYARTAQDLATAVLAIPNDRAPTHAELSGCDPVRLLSSIVSRNIA